MNDRDLKIASKVAKLVSQFPEEWSEYQDWLRELIVSRSLLRQHYSAWQTVVIFRWRLLYFLVYVGTMIVIKQLLRKLKSLLLQRDCFPFIISQRMRAIAQFLESVRYRGILQRAATLLAVAELTICGVAAFSGILLAFYYQPTALGAYDSLTAIASQVSNGSLILSLHNLAGHSLIVLALVQIVVMFLGREFLLSWLAAWISGICLTLAGIGLSWTAIILDWEQISFWRFKIELGIVSSIPLMGFNLRNILLGGNGISSLTVQHMYALHSYILATIATLLSITHLIALVCYEQKQTEVGSLTINNKL
jgi:quinol-cytochrome oxidoreductase complex cytochrome b subunit